MPCSCGYKKLFDEERQISTKYSGEFMDMFRKANEYRKKYDRLVVEYNELMEERNDLNLQVCILPILIKDIEVARIYFFTPLLFWNRV